MGSTPVTIFSNIFVTNVYNLHPNIPTIIQDSIDGMWGYFTILQIVTYRLKFELKFSNLIHQKRPIFVDNKINIVCVFNKIIIHLIETVLLI